MTPVTLTSRQASLPRVRAPSYSQTRKEFGKGERKRFPKSFGEGNVSEVDGRNSEALTPYNNNSQRA